MRTRILLIMLLFGSGIAQAADGRLEINHVAVLAGGITPGDTPGYPATLSESGSYVLTSNLQMPNENTSGIIVGAEFVSIDLNGFAIIGNTTCSEIPVDSCAPTGGGDGIRSTLDGTSVANGVVRGAGRYGVSISNDGGTIENVRAQNNGSTGLVVSSIDGDEGGIIRNCVSNRNGSDGIFVGDGGLAAGNVGYGNGRFGLFASVGSRVVDNTLRLNSGIGLFSSGGTGFSGNVITGNNGGDANAQTNGGGIQIGTNVCGTNTTCP